jgi:hypothetical protein
MNKLAPDTVRLTPEHLDEIRASVDWQAMFVGLGLRKAEGKSKPNDWWAFSPFHEEKTPGFHKRQNDAAILALLKSPRRRSARDRIYDAELLVDRDTEWCFQV